MSLAAVACNSPATGEIDGIWSLETFTIRGSTETVALGVNAGQQPYVSFDKVMTGSGGCNDFGGSPDSPYTFDNGVLRPGEIFFTLAKCLPESLNDAETALTGMLWDGAAINVTFQGEQMAWTAEGETLIWMRVDERPIPPPPPPTSFGPLDCLPDPVSSEEVPATGSDFADFAQQGKALIEDMDGVSTVEQSDPSSLVWYGYDRAGEAVAAVALNDIMPHTFSIYTCP